MNTTTELTAIKGQLNAPAIQTYLLAQLANQLRLDQSSVDPEVSLTQYGLDSIDALTLAGLELPSTLLWDYPTVADITGYVVDALRGKDSGMPGIAPIGEVEFAPSMSRG